LFNTIILNHDIITSFTVVIIIPWVMCWKLASLHNVLFTC